VRGLVLGVGAADQNDELGHVYRLGVRANRRLSAGGVCRFG
jgi:hypothetical protein